MPTQTTGGQGFRRTKAPIPTSPHCCTLHTRHHCHHLKQRAALSWAGQSSYTTPHYIHHNKEAEAYCLGSNAATPLTPAPSLHSILAPNGSQQQRFLQSPNEGNWTCRLLLLLCIACAPPTSTVLLPRPAPPCPSPHGHSPSSQQSGGARCAPAGTPAAPA